MPHQCTDCSRRFDDGSKEMLSGCPNCGGNKFQYIPTAEMDADGTPGETKATQSRTKGTESSVARTVGSAATAVRDLVGGSSGSESPPTSDVSTSAKAGTEGRAQSATTERRTETSSPSSPAAANADTAPATDAAATTDTDGNADTAANTDAAANTATPGRADTNPESSETAEAETGTRERPTGSDNIEATTGGSEDAAQASARTDLVSPDELPSVSEDQSGWEGATPAPPRESRASGTESDPDGGSLDEQATERPDLSELREELNEQFESIKVVEPGQYELNLMELFDRQEYIIALQEDGKYTVQVPEHWQD